MKYRQLYDEVYAEWDRIIRSNFEDIMDLPVVAVVRTPANTIHELQVTGWRLGNRAIELIIEQGDSKL